MRSRGVDGADIKIVDDVDGFRVWVTTRFGGEEISEGSNNGLRGDGGVGVRV